MMDYVEQMSAEKIAEMEVRERLEKELLDFVKNLASETIPGEITPILLGEIFYVIKAQLEIYENDSFSKLDETETQQVLRKVRDIPNQTAITVFESQHPSITKIVTLVHELEEILDKSKGIDGSHLTLGLVIRYIQNNLKNQNIEQIRINRSSELNNI